MQKIHRIFFQIAVVMVMLSVLLVGGASAFNEADLQKLKTTHQCPNCDRAMHTCAKQISWVQT